MLRMTGLERVMRSMTYKSGQSHQRRPYQAGEFHLLAEFDEVGGQLVRRLHRPARTTSTRTAAFFATTAGAATAAAATARSAAAGGFGHDGLSGQVEQFHGQPGFGTETGKQRCRVAV